MKKILYTILPILFLCGAMTTAQGQPVIDGTFDGTEEWGEAVGTNLTTGFNDSDAKELFVTSDENFIYFGALITARRWNNGVFAINTGNAGSTTDPWSRNVVYNHTEAPDLHIRIDFDGDSGNGYVETRSWNGSSWVQGTSVSYAQNFDTEVGDNDLQTDRWIEARIPRSLINDADDIDVQFLIVGNNNDNGSFNSIPLDNQQTDWNQQTTVSNYVDGIDVSSDVVVDPPGVVTLQSPADGATGQLRNVSFLWDAEPDAATYEIQVSTVSDFTTVVHWNNGITSTSTTLMVPFGETLYWRVRGVNAGGEGDWSTEWAFSTVEVDYEGSQTTAFGGPVGLSGMKWDLDGSTVNVTFYKGTNDFNNDLVLYLSTGHNGRTVIDSEVNDGVDNLRRAISSAGDDASDLTFPAGFEATHAIGINTGFGGLWEIPATGSIGDNGLIFRSAVNSTLDAPGDAEFEFSFDLNELFADGRQVTELKFVGIYLNGGNGFTSNEGYGGSFPDANIGNEAHEFTAYEEFSFPSNVRVLNSGAGWYMLSPLTTVNLMNLAALDLVQGIPGGSYSDFDPNLFVGYSGIDVTVPGPPRLVNGWLVPDNIENTAVAGGGFLWYLYDNLREDVPEAGELPLDLRQVGQPFTGAQAVPLHTDGNLFNMVGNPFNSVITSASVVAGAQNGTIQNTIRTYNPADGWQIVATLNPMDGFIIQNNDADGLVFMDALPLSAGNEQRLFNLELSGFSDERMVFDKNTMVSFHEDADFGWDTWEATALMPLSAPYNIASIKGEKYGEPVMLTRASFPYDLDEEITLPIHISAMGSQTELTYTLTQFENIPEDWEIRLIDLETGQIMSVTEGFEYTFDFEATEFTKSEDLLPIIEVVLTEKSEARFELVITPGVTTSSPISNELPSVFALNQNYPNPFNPTTQISYDLPVSADVRLEVYNIQGQKVATLVNASQTAGTHSVSFDAANMASGVYLYRLQAGATILTKKMTLVK